MHLNSRPCQGFAKIARTGKKKRAEIDNQTAVKARRARRAGISVWRISRARPQLRSMNARLYSHRAEAHLDDWICPCAPTTQLPLLQKITRFRLSA